MRNIKEDLNLLRQQDPNSEATLQANELGLSYVGFRRYEDPSTKQITHIDVNGKLTPFKKEIKTNRFKANHGDDLSNYNAFVSPEIEQLHTLLIEKYPPERFDEDELDALYMYTDGGYVDINQRLSELPAGVPSKEIEPRNFDDRIVNVIDSLDSALKKGRAPLDFITYMKLNGDYNFNDFLPGRTFIFKGYKDTSINLYTVINSSENTNKSPAGRNMALVLQIRVRKNSRGLYIANYSSMADDYEFLLPRNTVLEVLQAPMPLVGSNALTDDLNLEILYVDCLVKS